MRVAVIGAGPAGITAAYQLARAAPQVEVFEAGDTVGGLSRSFDLWGQKSISARIASSARPPSQSTLARSRRPDYRMVDRLTRIYYQKRFLRLSAQARQRSVEHGPGERGPLPGQLCEGKGSGRRFRTSRTKPSNRGSSAGLAARCSRCSSSPTAKSCGASSAMTRRRLRRPADQEILAGRGDQSRASASARASIRRSSTSLPIRRRHRHGLRTHGRARRRQWRPGPSQDARFAASSTRTSRSHGLELVDGRMNRSTRSSRRCR